MKNFDRLVQKTKYFKQLDEMDTNAILRCISAKFVDYYAGSPIVKEGDSTNSIYIILSGYARSFLLNQEGNLLIMQDYLKDSIFGIEYAATVKTYRENLIAIQNTSVLIIDSFRTMNPCSNRCKRHVQLLTILMEELSKQLVQSKKRITFICESKTRDKIMAYLKAVKTQTRKEYFTIPYNRQELSEFLGVERSALSCELGKLKKENIIDFDKSNFRIITKNKRQP